MGVTVNAGIFAQFGVQNSHRMLRPKIKARLEFNSRDGEGEEGRSPSDPEGKRGSLTSPPPSVPWARIFILGARR